MSELILVVAVIATMLTAPVNCDVDITNQVEILKVGNIEQEDIEITRDVLSSLPPQHLLTTNCECALREIVLVEGRNLEKLPTDAEVYKRNPEYNAARASGLAELKSGVIYVATDDDTRSILYHEIGHIVMDGQDKPNIKNATARYQLTGLFMSGDTSMGKNSRKNELEFRAEAYEHYMMGEPMSEEIRNVMQQLFSEE